MQEQTNQKSSEKDKLVATGASEPSNKNAAAYEPSSSLSASSELPSTPPRTTSRITNDGGKLLDKRRTKPSSLPSDFLSSSISVVGSMVNAYLDPHINASCSYGTQSVWYSLIGTGDVYSISTCSRVLNFDSSLSVMTGTCDSLECLIPGSMIEYACPEASYKAGRTLLRTDIGVEYVIAVLSTEYTLDGNFSLSVSIFEPLPNEECTGAVDIQASNGTVYGTTVDALDALNASITGSSGSARGPDLWYRIVGNGTNTVASLCGETDFDSYIQIFEGDGESCDRTLIAEDDDFCGSASEVQWLAQRGVTYYIRVTGFGTSRGQFGLTLRYP